MNNPDVPVTSVTTPAPVAIGNTDPPVMTADRTTECRMRPTGSAGGAPKETRWLFAGFPGYRQWEMAVPRRTARGFHGLSIDSGNAVAMEVAR
jgi:hypothetical protein